MNAALFESFLRVLILSLIANLGADEFAKRQQASAALAALMPAAMPIVEQAAKDDPDCEVRHRCASLAARHRPYWSYIDSLPEDHPDRWPVIEKYMALARKTTPTGDWSNDWPAWREATRLMVADYRAAGWKDAELKALAAKMLAGDAEQTRRYRGW